MVGAGATGVLGFEPRGPVGVLAGRPVRLLCGGAKRVTLADGAVIPAARAMLHAWRVRVPGAKRVIEAPLPADLVAVWTQSGGESDPLTKWVEPTG